MSKEKTPGELKAKLGDQRRRGEEARMVIENPLVDEVLTKIKDSIDESWKSSEPDDHTLRERLYLMQRLARNFEHEFKKMIVTGSDAGKQLLSLSDPETTRRT